MATAIAVIIIAAIVVVGTLLYLNPHLNPLQLQETFDIATNKTDPLPILPTINLNDLQYGFFNQVDTNFVATYSIKSFPLPLPLTDIRPPPANLSVDTIKELDFLVKMTDKATAAQKQSADRYEHMGGVYNAFINYCQQNKLLYDPQYLATIQDDIKCLCYKLKAIYQRPRPYQLSYYSGRQLRPRPIIQSTTPSYPSYSTLLAKTLANVLSYNNPNNSNELQLLAKEIELSRLLGGYNYPSDNKISNEIAIIIRKYIRYFERGSQLNPKST